MPRLFIAIDFPALIRQQLALPCHGLKGVRWTPEEQLHLTLCFVGEADAAVTADLAEALGEVSLPPFEMTLRGMGAFPPRGRPNILWAGVAAAPTLMELQQQVEKAARSAGVAPDKRRFTPHVTVGRIKTTSDRQVADWLAHNALFGTPPFTVEAFCLYSSVLNPAGAVHRREAEFPLTR
ncbi:MAG: RNA 2',3'-cyclic phosphodiesterase [Nitrospirota bacterium]|nr:RNA 2',3'-cyclic phosphodiesterase [Nitrospirota bacterium]